MLRKQLVGRVLTLALVLVLVACGGGQDVDESSAEDDWAAQDAAADAEEAAYWARATSDDRPVNLACNAPGYERGDSETAIGLHSPLYPAVQEAGEALKQQVRDLRPTVSDADVHDVERYHEAARAIIALSQWTFVMGQDAMPQSTVRLCDVNAYDDDQCRAAQMLAASAVEYRDFERDRDGLSYAMVYGDGSRTEITLANADLDGVTFQQTSNETGRYDGRWTRGADGTEVFEATSSEGQFAYTEHPDCSGTASARRTDDEGEPWNWSWTWTSVAAGDFSMTYQECKHDAATDEQVCVDGAL